MYNIILKLGLAVFLAGMYGPFVLAQDTPAVAGDTVETRDEGPEDVLGRGTPRGTVQGFFAAAGELDWDRAAEHLDLRNVPKGVEQVGGRRLARQLHHVLSRVWIDDFTISDSPDGVRGDGLPTYRDELVRIPTSEGETPIWLQRVPRGDGESIWKISNRSVAQIPTLYDQYSYSRPVERVRGWFPDDLAFLGVEAFKWFILAGVALLAWPLAYLSGLLLTRLFSQPGETAFPYVRRLFTGPLVLLTIVLTLGFVLRSLGAGAYARQLMITHPLLTLAMVWLAWSLIDVYRNVKQHRLLDDERPGAAKLLQPLSTLLKLVVLMFGFTFWLHNVGVNITTLLAGLGVGGLAIALALQKPIEDMMGALTIFSQASVRVGDLVRFGTTTGWVEDIGLRATRVRTLTNSVVSVPNSTFAYLELDNLTQREKIRYWPTLRLRYDTRRETIQRICTRISETLAADPWVYEEAVRARFTDFADDAILVKVHAFLKTAEFAQSLEYRERLNLTIMQIVEEEGAKFALPGTTLYVIAYNVYYVK